MYNWEVNIQVPMWIIHIKLKYFCWEENFSWDKRKENVDNWNISYLGS